MSNIYTYKPMNDKESSGYGQREAMDSDDIIDRYKELAGEGDLRCIMELIFNYAYVYNGRGKTDREEALKWFKLMFSKEEYIEVLRSGNILAQNYYAYAIELALDIDGEWRDREQAQIYFKKSLRESPVCLHQIISYVDRSYLNSDSEKRISKLDVIYAEELLELAGDCLPDYHDYIYDRNSSEYTGKQMKVINYLLAIGREKIEAYYKESKDSGDKGFFTEYRSNRDRRNNMYTPSPIDTSDVKLPDELIELTERIAENVHEVYVKSRLEEGWVYGACRDDEKKTNPTLVPYSRLPESEKEYDRNTALETIKLILKLGYRLEKI